MRSICQNNIGRKGEREKRAVLARELSDSQAAYLFRLSFAKTLPPSLISTTKEKVCF